MSLCFWLLCFGKIVFCFMYMEVKVILFILGFVGLGGLGDFWVFYGLKYVISLVGFVVYV